MFWTWRAILAYYPEEIVLPILALAEFILLNLRLFPTVNFSFFRIGLNFEKDRRKKSNTRKNNLPLHEKHVFFGGLFVPLF